MKSREMRTDLNKREKNAVALGREVVQVRNRGR